MKSKSSLFIAFFVAALCAFPTAAIGQPGRPSPFVKLPFDAGEKLVYQVKLSKSLIRGIDVADMTLSVASLPERDRFVIKAEAVSKGTLLRFFRYSFLQQLESTVGVNDFRVLRTVKRDVQKDRVRESEAVFEYRGRRVTYTELDPREPMRPPRVFASEIDGAANDLVSSVYALRTLPLEVGSSFSIKISDSGLVYDVPVTVTGRETLRTIFGRKATLRIEPDVFGPGRLVEKEGRMVIWVTDDARRVPVRAEIRAPIGKIDIRLKSAQNLR